MDPVITLDKIKALPSPMHLDFEGEILHKPFQHIFAEPTWPPDLADAMATLHIDDPHFASLYAGSNGFTLFSGGPVLQTAEGSLIFRPDPDLEQSGQYYIPPIRIYGLDDMEEETARVKNMIADICAGEELFSWHDCVAVGEAQGVAATFVLVLSGEFTGKIFYAEMDPSQDWYSTPFADSLADLLHKIAEPPHDALRHTCGARRIWF